MPLHQPLFERVNHSVKQALAPRHNAELQAIFTAVPLTATIIMPLVSPKTS